MVGIEGVLLAEDYDKGLGLIAMQEMTELSGGCFSAESSPGVGTTIRASWPVP